ncbi:glutamic acid-rich protein-like isoform X1 [Gigantopelta aegis]|uniref:glutamic acid-rich protein-like isoform X1 n=1 Tax=Gigantopelta aegis TaxID=1735272 RepID=UPI001B88D0C6|nr:glutamic acid-rich protein-like isoform X1 [Gigantopelta aegis]
MKRGGKGVFARQTSEKKNRKHSGADPWCLVCGVNLRVDGRSFLLLTEDNAADMRKLFAKILNVEVRDTYASVNLCNKCERALNRISRYDGTESAKKEAKGLRLSLQKNLKEHGQKIVDADVPEHEDAAKNGDVENDVFVENESPLIENEVKSNTKSEVEANQEQGTDPDLDQGQEPVVSPEQDKENIHPNKMPIKDFFKTTRKKKEKKEKKEKKKKEKELQKAADENATADGNTDQQESKEQGPGVKPGTLAALAQTVPKLPDPPRNWDSDPDPDPDAEQNVVDGGETYVPPETVIEDIINVTEETQDEKEKTEGEKPTDPEGPEVKPMEIAEPVKKSEKSPLIKESKLKDTGPGFLCCTIL